MVEIDIPGFGPVEIEHVVSDFTGTLSEDGRLCEGVGDALSRLAEVVEVHVLTADTFGTALKELAGLECKVRVLEGPNPDAQKADYVRALGTERVLAIGNGRNDCAMLAVACVGVAVCLREGCSARAIEAADVLVSSPVHALELLLHPKRLKATLRC
jgi:P-type E1-E2 ATPase